MLHTIYRTKKMRFRTIIFILMFLVLTVAFIKCSRDSSNDKHPYIPPPLTNTTWEMVSSPESVGWSTERLNLAYDYAQNIQTAAVMIIYDGRVLYYWGDITRKFLVHSIRKSFMSALYGIHVAEGNIDLSKTMGELGIDDLSPLSELEKTATVRMLLQARSGVYHPAACESQGMKDSRPERHSHAPGTFWYYNNWDFNVLGTIFEQETGSGIFEELKLRIADPIGMEDFEVSDGFYHFEPESIHACYPIRMTARDMARFGLLFLRFGAWEGNRIITEEWVNESTTSYSDAYPNLGYGYMWWIEINGGGIPNYNLNKAYSARGYGGHYIMVIHDLDLVIVHRVNTDLGHSVPYSSWITLLRMILDAKIN